MPRPGFRLSAVCTACGHGKPPLEGDSATPSGEVLWHVAAFQGPAPPPAFEARLEEGTLLAFTELQKTMAPLHVMSNGEAVWSV